jgi:uncharacterized RDD family membrane protein YckC
MQLPDAPTAENHPKATFKQGRWNSRLFRIGDNRSTGSRLEKPIRNMNAKGNIEIAGTPCGLFRRLLIMLYDGVIIVALLMLATAFAMLAGTGNHTALQDPLYTAYLILVWFTYLAWCWHKGGMTLGMRAWHVRITDETYRRPGWKWCALRFLTSILSAAPAGLGFLWSLIDSEKRTWHDKASRTRLLRY